MTMPGWAQAHHDGSATYVSDLTPDVGDTVTVFLRVPRASGVRQALLRVYLDGEQALTATRVDRQDEHETWLRADIPVENPVVNYRWLLDGVPNGYQWLTGTGLHAHDVTDASDFRITTHPEPPAWAGDAVLYQVFPDRFAKSQDRPPPDWAVPAAWSDPVIGAGPETPYQYFGGDLDGITAHLDHIASLGANTVYLTPIFPARSNHRYDASTFDHVDPLLGGDAALARLSDALHARGMRLVGDLTTNHCGSAHEWFQAAFADPDAPEAQYFTFTRHPDSYVCWFDHPTLPKFDHRSAALRRRLYEGPDSVVARWLGPHGFDGWRIDVANMTARLGTTDLNHMVATTMRATMAATNPDSLLLAEHSHDASRDLLGDGSHGVMNYAGFTRPVWQWLMPAGPVAFEPGPFTAIPASPGRAAWRPCAPSPPPSRGARQRTASPWSAPTTRSGSAPRWPIRAWSRWRSGCWPPCPASRCSGPATRSARRASTARTDAARSPGAGRRPGTHERLASTRAVFAARAGSRALRHGGLRWLSIGADSMTFLRESPGESVLVHAARSDHTPVRLPVAVAGRELTGLAGTPDLHADADGAVTLPSHGPGIGIWRC